MPTVDLPRPLAHLLLRDVDVVGGEVVLEVAVQGHLLEDHHPAGLVVEDVPGGDAARASACRCGPARAGSWSGGRRCGPPARRRARSARGPGEWSTTAR
ncbi:hypothetical protein TYRP_022775 [Tyrophagus putrescentiae]|nr:hypothetical protein TYRP_022775 [Tyrophagus putrescentiae]